MIIDISKLEIICGNRLRISTHFLQSVKNTMSEKINQFTILRAMKNLFEIIETGSRSGSDKIPESCMEKYSIFCQKSS